MAAAARFRLTPPPVAELDLHAVCAAYLDRCLAPPATWFSYPAGHVQLSSAEVARLTRIGLKRGLPDIWLLHRGVYCIELKREGGALSKTRVGRTHKGSPRIFEGQEEVFPRLIRSGAVRAIAVCTNLEEMIARLREWEIPLRC